MAKLSPDDPRLANLERAREALRAKREAGTLVYKKRKPREKAPEPFHRGRFILDEQDRLQIFDADGEHGVELEPELTAALRAFLSRCLD